MFEQQYRQAAIQTAMCLCKHKIEVFPCQYGSKGGGVYWKDIATSDPNKFVKLVKSGLFNLAMTFGPGSGVMDIEPDTDAAVTNIERLMAENGVKTIAYKSRRGIHRIFRWSPVFSHFGKAALKADGLDIRYGTSDLGCYSICPPSLHPDTKQHYSWLPGCAPWEVEPAELPKNVIEYILATVKVGKNNGMVLDVDAHDDGYMPGVGGRHEYLLGFSKLLYTNLLMPSDMCMDLTREVSQRIGSYAEEGRGEKELVNLFKGLKRPVDPVKEMSAHISMSVVNEVVEDTFSRHAATNVKPLDELPSHIFHPMIEAASQEARKSQHPRNLWLNTIMAAAASAVGTGSLVRASPDHPTTAMQLYLFGVGGSGYGKSKVLKTLLAPFAGQENVITDATPEALTASLARHPRGVLLELSEGKEFYKMLGRYNSAPGQGSDNSLFHKCWSGDRMRIQRKSGGFWIENPFLVVSAAIQKLNLNMIPQNDVIDGLMQRMCPYPIGLIPKKASRSALAAHAKFIREWYNILGRLMSVKVTSGNIGLESLVNGLGVNVQPNLGTLSEEAFLLWEDYAALKRSDQVEAQWPDPDHPFRSDIVRHAEIALRLALGHFWIDNACNAMTWELWRVPEQDYGIINANQMQRAIDHMEFFWHHKQVYMEAIAEAAFGAASGDHMLARNEGVPTKVDKYVLARRNTIERRMGDEWSLRDYYSVFKLKKMEAQRELDLFQREGHIVVLEPKEHQRVMRYSFVDMQ